MAVLAINKAALETDSSGGHDVCLDSFTCESKLEVEHVLS
jgi:hypothetical protein